MISFTEFDSGLRQICTAFGVQYNTQKAQVYYEFLHPWLDDSIWRKIVIRSIENMDSFPRVSSLISAAREIKRGQEPIRDWASEWVLSDCRVRECVDGIIFRDLEEGPMGFKCPKCNRAEISKLKISTGPVTLYSDEEMERRLKERREIYGNYNYRLDRGKEIVKEIGELFTIERGEKTGTGAGNPSNDPRIPSEERDFRMEE